LSVFRTNIYVLEGRIGHKILGLNPLAKEKQERKEAGNGANQRFGYFAHSFKYPKLWIYHGLRYLMGKTLIVELFAFSSPVIDVSLSTLDNQPKLPSDFMFDNLLLYGEYEVVGRGEIGEEEFNFPISYSAVWGVILIKEAP